MRDIFIEILTTIKHNRLRTALTGFSVAWGIFILIVLLGAGNGLINAMMGNSNRFLATSMVVYGGETSKAYDGLGEGRSVELNDKDMSITKEGFNNNVETVGAELSQQGETLVNGSNYTTGIKLSGVYPNDIYINKRTMVCGRFINQLDLKDRRKSIVISSDMAKELLPQSPLALNGQLIRTTTLAFRVVGIYESQKNSMGNDAFIPFTTFRAIYSKGDKTGDIVFSFSNLNSEAENAAFESNYRARINRQHRAAPDDENAVWIWNRFTQALSMNTANGLLSTALWVIGILTLISGIEHHAHHRTRTHSRVRHTQGYRRQAVVYPAPHHHRERRHHYFLRLHRHAARHRRQPVYGRHHRKGNHRQRTLRHTDVHQPHRGLRHLHKSHTPDDSRRHARRTNTRSQGSPNQTD